MEHQKTANNDNGGSGSSAFEMAPKKEIKLLDPSDARNLNKELTRLLSRYNAATSTEFDREDHNAPLTMNENRAQAEQAATEQIFSVPISLCGFVYQDIDTVKKHLRILRAEFPKVGELDPAQAEAARFGDVIQELKLGQL